MNIKRIILKVLYSNEAIYNIYKREKCRYHTDLFKKKKYKTLLKEANFKYDNDLFYYFINNEIRYVYYDRLIDNISINYGLIINNSLNDLLETNSDPKFKQFIIDYFACIRSAVLKSNNVNKTKVINVIDGMFSKKSDSLFDSLQRILFVNQMLWQTGHRLNVLGRLDFLLDDIYKKSTLDYEESKQLVKEFLVMLDKDYQYKSNALKGDTGQVVIVGGNNLNGTYFSNDLTSIFIECVKELQLPDPKVLLRVSKKVPNKILELAVSCIKTGCGSPLLSNDDVVVPALLEIGYTEPDAHNYATSACWEPLCDGASLEQNNIYDLNFVEVLNKSFDSNSSSFESIINSYLKCLEDEICQIVAKTSNVSFAYDPLLSLFLLDCNKKHKDVSQGGARYNNYGILTTGLGNTIDSLLNIKHFVFDEKKYSLNYLIEQRNYNFKDDELLTILKNSSFKYGKDDEEVIKLTNIIIDKCNSEFAKYKNKFGGNYRFGLSSPNYISQSKNTKASLDGRRDSEPFIVHISSNSNCSFTELINFACSLKYGGRNVNGNVVDLMITPSLIENNCDKFIMLLKIAIENGIFQMQFNVVDYKTLLEAKKSPDKYRNLIVRVWGFSAYFIDLPEEYQDLLIRRAMQSENSCG